MSGMREPKWGSVVVPVEESGPVKVASDSVALR